MPFSITVSGDTLEECIAALFQQAKRIVSLEEPKEVPQHQVAAMDETASLPPVKKVDAEALRTEIRATLGPLMKTDQAATARALVKSFGDGIASVPEDRLEELLEKARSLVGGAA